MLAATNRTLINKKTLLAMIPLCERTIYNLEQRGEFPTRMALTSRNVVWDLADIEHWIESRKASGNQARRPGRGA
jgi:prophage regulatory protein